MGRVKSGGVSAGLAARSGFATFDFA